MKSDRKALDVFRSVMETEETFYVRIAALELPCHLKADPCMRGLIELGTKDKDERVSQRANQISTNRRNEGMGVSPLLLYIVQTSHYFRIILLFILIGLLAPGATQVGMEKMRALSQRRYERQCSLSWAVGARAQSWRGRFSL